MPGVIKNKKYRSKLRINGYYLSTFRRAGEEFKKNKFKYLRHIYLSEKNLSMTFLVYNRDLYSILGVSTLFFYYLFK
jgi:hypothetical protein